MLIGLHAPAHDHDQEQRPSEPPNVFRVLSTPIDPCFDVTRGCNSRCVECLREHTSLLALRGFTQVDLSASLRAGGRPHGFRAGQRVRLVKTVFEFVTCKALKCANSRD